MKPPVLAYPFHLIALLLACLAACSAPPASTPVPSPVLPVAHADFSDYPWTG